MLRLIKITCINHEYNPDVTCIIGLWIYKMYVCIMCQYPLPNINDRMRENPAFLLFCWGLLLD